MDFVDFDRFHNPSRLDLSLCIFSIDSKRRFNEFSSKHCHEFWVTNLDRFRIEFESTQVKDLVDLVNHFHELISPAKHFESPAKLFQCFGKTILFETIYTHSLLTLDKLSTKNNHFQ